MKIETKLLESKTLIDTTLDLNALIDDASDLIELNNCIVTGTIYRDYQNVILDLNVEVDVVQKCSITLKPVPYHLSFESEINFSDDIEKYDYVPTDEIDLNEIIFAEISIEKDLNVYHESADLNQFNEPKEVHPAFKDLKEKIKD